MKPFDYPKSTHSRRHGPEGYSDYESYREWLRDEFSYRCVFSLDREVWGLPKGRFHIDHYVPQVERPDLECDYDNLFYLSAYCNSVKNSRALPNPEKVALGECISVEENGVIAALNDDGQMLIDCLNLDDPQLTNYRKRWIRLYRILKDNSPDEFRRWFGYPENLTDLSTLRPRSNKRPNGISRSSFARRQKNELPEVY